MRDVVIASYVRSAQSRCRPKDPDRDWLFKIRGDDLLARLLPEAIRRAGAEPGEIDDFIMGCAQAVGENFTFGGRGPHLLANLDKRTSCKQIDEQCGSTMAALQMGFMEIAQGFADTVLIGGVEHMGRLGMGGDGKIELNLRLFTEPSLLHWDFFTAMNMGLTAEKLADMGYAREDMDAWGARSHQLAHKAQQEGFFDEEIMPLDIPQADGSVKTIATDQSVRADATVEDMARLKPVFKKGGTIHPGNSSPLNAGACALVLMDRATAEAKGVTPLARIVSMGFAGVEPNIMGTGPVPSSKRALEAAGLEASDIDFWEINEAFAVVALYAIKELGIDPDKVNVKGGGVAIGHPLGATGGRLVGTLARILQSEGGRYGCATMCVGAGQGVAMIIENEAMRSPQ
ncbi:MAG: acetyl-CoA C-acetyltransferase [Xanthomonadales bacterium]|nr:acetyl-CoA C-acetyltransferase [Xanthomonadales bacterium]